MTDLVLLSPEAQDFCRGVVVDHIDGVVAEALIDEHFSSDWELLA